MIVAYSAWELKKTEGLKTQLVRKSKGESVSRGRAGNGDGLKEEETIPAWHQKVGLTRRGLHSPGGSISPKGIVDTRKGRGRLGT